MTVFISSSLDELEAAGKGILVFFYRQEKRVETAFVDVRVMTPSYLIVGPVFPHRVCEVSISIESGEFPFSG